MEKLIHLKLETKILCIRLYAKCLDAGRLVYKVIKHFYFGVAGL